MAIISALNNRFTPGVTTTAGTSFGTLTLTSASNQLQIITGTASFYTVQMPVESTLPNGFSFTIANTSSQEMFVNSSGGNSIISLLAGNQVTLYLVNNSVTTAAAWNIISTNPPTVMTTGSVAAPYLTMGGSPTGITYNLQSGTWNQISNNGITVTFFDIYIALLTYSGVTSGNMSLTNLSSLPNLPTTPAYGIFQVAGISSITYTGTLIAMATGSGSIGLYSQVSGTSGNNTILTNTAFTSTSQFHIHGFF